MRPPPSVLSINVSIFLFGENPHNLAPQHPNIQPYYHNSTPSNLATMPGNCQSTISTTSITAWLGGRFFGQQKVLKNSPTVDGSEIGMVLKPCEWDKLPTSTG